MSQIIVYSERDDLVCEMLGRACALKNAGLSDEVVAVGWGSPDDYARFGADRAHVCKAADDTVAYEAVTPTLVDYAQADTTPLILIGATKRGKDVAARLATRLAAPCITEVGSIDADGHTIKTSSTVLGGKGIQTDTFDCATVIASAAPKRFEKVEKPGNPVASDEVVIAAETIRVVERRPDVSNTIDLADANVVVCVGRGFNKQDDLSLARDLASALGGAVGCTRPIAEDFGWMPTNTYIGLSGKRIAPSLYLALGCSGQIQHVAGVVDAKTIVAIDKDERAPILEAADYAIVGDLYEIVPALIADLKG